MNEASEVSGEAPQAALVDMEHFQRFTMGDRDLQREVLGLFQSHSKTQMDELQAAVGNPKAWHAATHGLKGSARGIGAWSLGDAAEAAERDQAEPTEIHRQHLSRVTECLAATNAHIDDLLAQN